ncbi:MAG: exodeoxyribonuclease VII large subunit [Candidatus Saccharibacteria bacterium]|nr:exodeoxyribonuclease VII large subunit [Candidatus Saccharibacteria bacterium]
MEKAQQVYSVSDFQAVCNQIMETAFTGVIVEGEVASFKLNQNKFVFFDLKDDQSSVGCFMMAFALRFPIEDGMRVRIRAVPKLTNWGKFSLTVQAIAPVGEGSIKKSLELLKKKLAAEGLFDKAKKRPLPDKITKIGVISSTQAAGYADFCKILNERWGGLTVLTAHTQVQGMVAADQIIRALNYFNERGEVDVIAVIRGGGSADDLAVFNDEALVRAIAASKIPVITGIGHEVDESLCDLAADIVASTPSNAAQMLTRDRREIAANVRADVNRINNLLNSKIDEITEVNRTEILRVANEIYRRISSFNNEILAQRKILDQLNPEKVLERGYALLRGDVAEGNEISLLTAKQEIEAKVMKVKERK